MKRFLSCSLAGLAVLFGAVLAVGQEATAGPKPLWQEVIYGHKDGLALTFDVFEPSSEANGAAVVFMVSGGWRSMWVPPLQTQALMAPYLNAGYRVFAVRHGSSPRYSIAEAIEDVRLAIRKIRSDAKEFNIDPERIGVVGMSAGGHLTLMLATTGDDGDSSASNKVLRESSRIAAGVALVPPSDITDYVWSTPDLHPRYRKFPGLDITKDAAKAVSPLYFVTKDDAPCLIIVGGKDELVPAEQGEWIHEKMDKVGVTNRLIVYPDADHGLGTSMQPAIDESIKWFDEYLKP